MVTGKEIKMREDRAAQGSLKYLLILAAVLAIGVVAVLIANQMMGPAKTSAGESSLANIEIKGYGKSFDMSSNETAFETRPEKLIYSPDSEKIVFKPYDKWEHCNKFGGGKFYYKDSLGNLADRSIMEDVFDGNEAIKDWKYLFTFGNGYDVFLIEWEKSCQRSVTGSCGKELHILAYDLKHSGDTASAYYKSEDCLAGEEGDISEEIGPAEESKNISRDKYQASLANIEIKGYDKPFDMSSEETAFETRPEKLIYSPPHWKEIVFKPYDRWEHCKFGKFYRKADWEDLRLIGNFVNRSATEDALDELGGLKDWEYLFTMSDRYDVFLVEWTRRSCHSTRSEYCGKELKIFGYNPKYTYTTYSYYRSQDCQH